MTWLSSKNQFGFDYPSIFEYDFEHVGVDKKKLKPDFDGKTISTFVPFLGTENCQIIFGVHFIFQNARDTSRVGGTTDIWNNVSIFSNVFTFQYGRTITS